MEIGLPGGGRRTGRPPLGAELRLLGETLLAVRSRRATIMTRRQRTVRVLDGIIIVLVVAVLFSWGDDEQGSEDRGTMSRSMSLGFTEPRVTIARPELIRRGASLVLPNVTLQEGVRNVFLLVSATCSACNDSVYLYRRLGDYVRTTPEWRFVVATAEDVETVGKWADKHEIRYDVLVEMKSAVSSGFTLTPTLLLTDDDGTVTDVLLRRLSTREESMLWQRLRRPDSVSPLTNVHYAAEIDRVEFQELLRTQGERVMVIDVRSRSNYQASGMGQTATNIPIDELAIRGRVELPGRAARGKVVVDCTAIDWVRCRQAGRILEDIGMENSSLLMP